MTVELKLRVFWIPQISMEPFYVDVSSVDEGVKIIDILAKYDLFQYKNNIKPDYSNAGGLEMWEDGEWVDWYGTIDGEWFDDLDKYIATLESEQFHPNR